MIPCGGELESTSFATRISGEATFIRKTANPELKASLAPKRREKKMKQERPAKILSLALLFLCFPTPLQAATSDDFIQGYASAVLGREFHIKNFSLSVVDEAVRVTSSDLSGVDYDQVTAALLSIQGIKKGGNHR